MMLQLLCTEYSNLLMKDVLMRPCVCLPPSMWHGMCNEHLCMYVHSEFTTFMVKCLRKHDNKFCSILTREMVSKARPMYVIKLYLAHLQI